MGPAPVIVSILSASRRQCYPGRLGRFALGTDPKKKNYEDSEHGPICGRGVSCVSLKKIFFYREYNFNGRGVMTQIWNRQNG